MNGPEPLIRVGILEAGQVEYSLNGTFRESESRTEKKVFIPASPEATFTLHGVTIGKQFHWERRENQTFRGSLCLLSSSDGKQRAINILPLEEYLTSVISSEMSATSSLELLKAHAIISRSWALAQIRDDKTDRTVSSRPTEYVTGEKVIRWYDHSSHTDFDVCADDHCQRYQGITRATNPNVEEAIRCTRGIVLTHDGKICDARFSKCCGGMMEEFPSCWEERDVPYLQALPDREGADTRHPDLRVEAEAGRWIRSTPPAFCNTHDPEVLKQILNNYDQETADFYRWRVEYSRSTLSELIHRKSGIDFGEIRDLIPLQRGPSGRIILLHIIGTRCSRIIGKELEIRRILSESHLYSSAFVVDVEEDRFILTGAGWGHGVGLCQIGAALMAAKGYTYAEILRHYYPGAQLEKRYE